MMTSFRWFPPICPNSDSVQLDSIDSVRLLACLALLGVVQMTRQNDTSLLELGFGRSQDSLPTPTSLPCQSQFLHGGRLLATLSRRMPHDNQNFLSYCSVVSTFRQRHHLHSVLFGCIFFFTAARSPMSLDCFKCIIPYYALPTFNTLLLQPDSLPTPLHRFFFLRQNER
jgi:hypothetical protein